MVRAQRRKLILLVGLVFLTGCWDQLEIEDVGFVMGVALDPINDQQQAGENVNGFDINQPLFRITHQTAIPERLTQVGGDGGSSKGEAPFVNIVSTNASNMDAARRAAAKNSRFLNFEHLKVLIIHEDLVRQGLLGHLVDFYIRDHQMRRKTFVFISDVEGKAILEKTVPLEDIPALFMEKLSENDPNVLQMPKVKEIGELSQNIIEHQSYIVPRITMGPNEGDYVMTGAAVFRGGDDRMVGWLGEYDLQGYNWMVGEAKNGVLHVGIEEQGRQKTVVFETDQMITNVHYERENGQDHFKVNIEAKGTIVESWLEELELEGAKVKKAIEEKIEKQANDIVRKTQEEFQVDIFDFINFIKHCDYPYWEKVKDTWSDEDGQYKDAQIDISASVKIRHQMLQENVDY
ncbi:Ger(x)C family spore germination protein [Halalkalibacterium halodurans]|uniref:Ger(x)C family spore germination protein n=1 Tax=Halalkalibacterium halodurans TaxID=86665 RepID=UPI002AA9701D|nr:Ger(x)C family spore germination protein [Halalkalibacterium halodurans]MDY7222550.1 Ger(x)C family spore germination protein [Halalkalibacterium halodurans]MDY7241771.1 Ger(x)C family spore germination protein [Halalkalibacterium halodurans]MED4082606.1 Ger(x)C family spore germination protein [Halalkalibacterium halodurans]MED4085940.1 Ger(x)C family spore germination protein [Halalkalibacterium halodurans]MED4104034.1 Ger(x)C family spore germination protein [Halalkalibacterium haloduran